MTSMQYQPAAGMYQKKPKSFQGWNSNAGFPSIDVRLDHRLQQIEKQLKAVAADDPMLTVKDVAKIIKCSTSTANKLFNETRFPGKKIPNVGWRVRRSKLYEFIENLNNYTE